ncbi:uncharacterized protein N7496_007281 [Penicillium cataractarum]|uniref:Xylanolytic transcriptional activator regulatory domain-containing protein n=1 Tax=Penicillium cataractarum TaxID=2100454 RepID=A0A9W9S580_9EURO|nr:uncharacterized protein N7496_007281 [Penicillium cataractarum]KAJ5371189.1 hypothetical protein N7496_007281 [Penicillium cataractarum]
MRNLPSNLQGESHSPVSRSVDLSSSVTDRPTFSSDQTELRDWDLQWPFYGEGLPDVNLGWTLDFLSNDASTHSPLDFMHSHEEMSATIPLDHSSFNHRENEDQHPVGSNDLQDVGHQGWSSRTHPIETSGPAAYVDIDEINNAVVTNLERSNVSVPLSKEIHKTMVDTVTAPLLEGFCNEKGKYAQSFPSLSTISYFHQLFFAHVQPRFPVLHIPTFNPNDASPNLLLAMAIVGSCYSESNQGKFALTYLERTRMSIKLMQERDNSYLCSLENLLAFLFVSLSAMWVGQKVAYERAECDRGELAVYCRRLQLLDCRVKQNTSPQMPSRQNRSRFGDAWSKWINIEQKKRLGLCIYLLDCQVAALFQRQPYISKAETVNAALPCSGIFWNAPTAWAWKALLGPAEIPPSTYFLTTLTTILLHNEIPGVLPFPALDDFCKTLYAYVLHTHIFEWRQTICMLNPTGLVTSPVSLAPENIGATLQERRNWLERCLLNWASFYGDGSQADSTDRSSKTFSGILLYHLANLAIHLNFSDLHIVAGRSGSDADIGLAMQSLRNWLQKERAQNIFACNSQMLNAAHEAITAGDAQRSGFELAVSLFMGGLISWAISRFGSCDIMTLHLNDPRTSDLPQAELDGDDDGNQLSAGDSSQVVNLLLDQVAGARDGLRTVTCVRLAASFGEILDRLLTEPVN